MFSQTKNNNKKRSKICLTEETPEAEGEVGDGRIRGRRVELLNCLPWTSAWLLLINLIPLFHPGGFSLFFTPLVVAIENEWIPPLPLPNVRNALSDRTTMVVGLPPNTSTSMALKYASLLFFYFLFFFSFFFSFVFHLPTPNLFQNFWFDMS